MSLPVVVIGGGGHAKVIIASLLALHIKVLGVVDVEPSRAGGSILGVPIIGDDMEICRFPAEKIRLINGLGSVGTPLRRAQIFGKFKASGYVFATVVDPAAIIAVGVELGEGAQVMAGAVIQPGSQVGVNTIINTRASVDHDCVIGEHVHIAPGVTLSGGVAVGTRTHLGTGSTVIQGVSIAHDCFVAAGAVVTKDIAAGVKVRGVPAREYL